MTLYNGGVYVRIRKRIFASDAFQMTPTRRDRSLFPERKIRIRVTANLTPIRSGKGRLPHRDGVTQNIPIANDIVGPT
jgi:hypothetical protein